MKLSVFNKILKQILFLAISYQLSGCGAAKNIADLLKSTTSVYTGGDNIGSSISFKTSKIMLRITDVGILKPKQLAKFKGEIISELRNRNFQLVDTTEEADIVVNISIQNFTRISRRTADNIKKYLTYKNTLEKTSLHHNTESGSDFHFNVADEDIGFANTQNPDTKFVGQSSTFSKLMAVDFASGAAIGTIIAFLAFSVNPLTLVIGALAGAVATSILEIITRSSNYHSSINIQIEKRLEKPINVKRKTKSAEGTNHLIEQYSTETTQWRKYNSAVILITENAITKNQARKAIITSGTKGILNILQ